MLLLYAVVLGRVIFRERKKHKMNISHNKENFTFIILLGKTIGKNVFCLKLVLSNG